MTLAVTLAGWPIWSRAAAPADLVQAELIAEPAAIIPGQPFWVGLRLRIKDHWHVYWRNPGDSGEAPTITWQLPAGFSAAPIAWPTPQRIPIAHLANYGYEHETTLLTRITPAPQLEGAGPVALKADVTWLVCERECIPGEASLSLSLKVAEPGASPTPDPANTAAFETARRALPQRASWPARLAVAPDQLTLDVDTRDLDTRAIRSASFFPNSETLVRHAAPQPLSLRPGGLTLRLERNAVLTEPPTDAGGLLVLEEDTGGATARHAFELSNVAVRQGPPPSAPASLSAILQAASLALIGGMILNLMPCVFPVLSIKVLALVDQAGGSAQNVRRHGLAYAAGVLLAFAALGAALLAVRAAGAEVGWGFQLQSPVAVALLAYLLFAMGLSLSGAFHFGSSLQGIGYGLTRRAGLAGSFFTGVLAAIVATPCTAPFMGSALGFALTQPAPLALAVILALGLGLALPFLMLTFAPHLISRLPRPGAWMETLRQVLAFPVYATVAWLVWVLGQLAGPSGFFAALIGLVLVGLAAWSFNAGQSANGWGRRAATAVLIISFAGMGAAIVGLARDRPDAASGVEQAASNAPYEHFTQARLDELIAARRPVFVNMTAAWCITCLVNERTALSSEAVRAAFAAKDVAYLKGDWTRRNPEITRLLEKHGRSGVPLYLLYGPGGEPVVLPQILTSATVLGELDRIAEAPQRKASLSTTATEQMP